LYGETGEGACLVEVVVLADELLQLGLHVDNLGGWELEFNNRHASLLQVLQEADLGRLEEHQTATLAVGTTGGTSDTVNIVTRIIRGIELDDPVDRGDIQTTSSNIGTDQGTLLGIAKLEESVGALLLLLLSVKLENGKINVVQQLGVVLNTVAAGEEDNDLLFEVTLEEGEEKQETLVGFTEDVALLQTGDGAMLFPVVNINVQRSGAQRYPGQVLDLGGLCGGEEHGLTFFGGQDLDDLAHFILESDFQNTIRLINDQGLQVLEDESLGILQVIE
jgi:hypothetical protein